VRLSGTSGQKALNLTRSDDLQKRNPVFAFGIIIETDGDLQRLAPGGKPFCFFTDKLANLPPLFGGF